MIFIQEDKMSTEKTRISLWDRIMMAITFAEADDEKTARELLTPGKTEKRPEARPQKESEQRPELRA
jgi:hypothetical protein